MTHSKEEEEEEEEEERDRKGKKVIFLSRSGDRDANTATYLCARRERVCVYVLSLIHI